MKTNPVDDMEQELLLRAMECGQKHGLLTTARRRISVNRISWQANCDFSISIPLRQNRKYDFLTFMYIHYWSNAIHWNMRLFSLNMCTVSYPLTDYIFHKMYGLFFLRINYKLFSLNWVLLLQMAINTQNCVWQVLKLLISDTRIFSPIAYLLLLLLNV